MVIPEVTTIYCDHGQRGPGGGERRIIRGGFPTAGKAVSASKPPVTVTTLTAVPSCLE